jgi:hypothetical protein
MCKKRRREREKMIKHEERVPEYSLVLCILLQSKEARGSRQKIKILFVKQERKKE